MKKKLLFLVFALLSFTITKAQIQYFDVSKYCVFCYEGSNANDTVADGILQERHFFILDNNRDEFPDNNEFDLTLQVQGEKLQKQFLILARLPGQGVVGTLAFDGSSFYGVSKLDAGVSIYSGTEPGWCMGPNYATGGATAMFGIASSNSLLQPYLKWNDAETDKYVGMSLSSVIDNKPLYGWIRLTKPAGVDYIVVKDWAYNMTAGQPIVTGSKELPVLASSISISSQSGLKTITTPKGTLQLTANITPSNALIKSVEWSFDGTYPSGLTISKDGLVTGLLDGNYKIKATGLDGSGVSATIDIVVSGQIMIPAASVTIGEQDGANVINTDNGYLLMWSKVLPTDATVGTVAWSVNNQNAVIDKNGKLTAKRDGTVVVTATTNDGTNKTATYSVTISNQIVTVEYITVSGAGNSDVISTDGGSLQMSVSVSPSDAVDKTILWDFYESSLGASISSTGELKASGEDSGNGVVTVIASNNATGVVGKKDIIISNQMTPPKVLSAKTSSDGKSIEVLFSKSMSSTIATGSAGFSTSPINTIVSVTPRSGDSKSYIITLSSVFTIGANILLSYTPGNVKSIEGYDLASLSKLVVSNQSTVPAVASIVVSGNQGANSISVEKGTLQMSAAVSPLSATQKVSWSVSNGNAKISETGLLTAISNGDVTVIATATDNSGVSGNLGITISNQNGVTSPLIQTCEVSADGKSLIVSFDKEMVGALTKSTKGFSVMNITDNNKENVIASITIDKTTMTMVLTDTIRRGDDVTISYDGTGDIKSTDGGILSEFQSTVYPVTNNSSLERVSVNQIPEKSILLWPNPAKDELRIQMENEGNYSISIIDISGKKLLSKTMNKQTGIDIKSLKTGIYFIKVSDGVRTGSKMFIKE